MEMERILKEEIVQVEVIRKAVQCISQFSLRKDAGSSSSGSTLHKMRELPEVFHKGSLSKIYSGGQSCCTCGLLIFWLPSRCMFRMSL